MAPNQDSQRKQQPVDGTDQSNEWDFIDSVFDLTEEKVERLKHIKPKLLGIKCRRADCGKGLHCFDARRAKPKFEEGRCQECGADLVKWDEVWLRDTRDVEKKFAFFETEWIRHFFFHVPLTSRIRKYANNHGLAGLGRIVEDQLRSHKMLKYLPAFDRTQTPMLRGTIIHWARHAVACCCRACMCYWHNVPLDQELTDQDIQYFKALALKFIEKRMPDLGMQRH
ncbi:MAG: DUF4186 domain-containing protein [Nitrososphaera sp.]|nr:DUF4186 domain-containing protein [Nitrososphaera sp.]